MSVSFKCCVSSGRGFYDGPITLPVECGVSECDREASIMGKPWSMKGCSFIRSFGILSNDRSKASSKTVPPHSAI